MDLVLKLVVHVASLVLASLVLHRDQLLVLLWTKVRFVVPSLSFLELLFAELSIFYLCLDDRQVVAFVAVIEVFSLRSQSVLVRSIVDMFLLFVIFVPL